MSAGLPAHNGQAPPPAVMACLHARLLRVLALRQEAGVGAVRAEGTEGWCEECRRWVDVGRP